MIVSDGKELTCYLPQTGVKAIALPSTSAANCRFYSYEALVEAYAVVKPFLTR